MKNRTFLYNIILLFLRHKNHSKFLFTIHFHNNRPLKVYVTKIFSLKYGRLRIQKLLVVYSIIHKRIDGEITYTKGGQILEEMRPLTGSTR